jgi:alanyl-tRNA synthetase
VYETELFQPILEHIDSLAQKPEQFAKRVLADHTRAAVFILAEGVVPGNVDQPYIARRLIRRAVRYGKEIGIQKPFLPGLAQTVIGTLEEVYPELHTQREQILSALEEEESRFGRTLEKGKHAFLNALASQPDKNLPGEVIFHLYDTYGFPPELTQELAEQQGYQVDMEGYRRAFAGHQAKSRQGSEARFKGGLSERSPETTRLHTATHLLHEALRQVLGTHVEQRGSNITTERLRFDFSHNQKLTPEQLAQVEAIVNQQIQRNLPVSWEEMPLEEAKNCGAIGLFEARYGDRVKVYQIGDFSKEICGGPHVEATGQLGQFKITKEEAVASGIRRIRAVLTG